MKLSRLLLCCLVLFVGFTSGSLRAVRAAEPTREEVSQSIDDLLAQMHPRETPDTWRALGSAAPGLLIEKYTQTTHSFKKARILRALGAFDDPVAVEFLKKEALSQQNAAARGDALRAIGLSQGPKALEFLEGFLGHENAQTRLVAADVIRQMSGEKPRKAYEGFLAREKAPWVREKLESAQQRQQASAEAGARAAGVLDAGFEGKWRGFWIASEAEQEAKPGVEAEASLQSLAAELEFRGDGSAELTIRPSNQARKRARNAGGKPTVRKLRLTGIQRDGVRIRGRIAEGSRFEAEQAEARAGFLLLRLRTEDGSTLVAERAVPVPIPSRSR